MASGTSHAWHVPFGDAQMQLMQLLTPDCACSCACGNRQHAGMHPPSCMEWVLQYHDELKHVHTCVRHAQTDGKAARNLLKLQLFRQFYVLVVAYIYITRIVVYLLRSTMPYRYVWLSDAAGACPPAPALPDPGTPGCP